MLTVTRKRSLASRPTGWSAIDGTAPTWTLEEGQSSSGTRRSRTNAARRPSAWPPSPSAAMSSMIRTPWPRRSAPQTCRASAIEGSPKASPAWIVMWKLSRITREKASRWREGGWPASGPAMSKPQTPWSRWRRASSAISRLLACWRIAEQSTLTVSPRPALPRSNPASTASTTSSRLRPASMWSSGAKRTSA